MEKLTLSTASGIFFLAKIKLKNSNKRNNLLPHYKMIYKIHKKILCIILLFFFPLSANTRLTYDEMQKTDFDKPWRSILHHDSVPSCYKNHIRRTTILNTLIEKFGYRSYLEIGQGPGRGNFDWVNCPIKIGVDPDVGVDATYQITSDEFFAQNKDRFDLIFIDGLHHDDQVEKDILNALEILNGNGTIVVHDCNPTNEAMQIVPRQQPNWTGNVWKAWVRLRATRPDLTMYVIDTNYGCGIIRRGNQQTIKIHGELTYRMLDNNRKEFLNLVDIDYFLEDLMGK